MDVPRPAANRPSPAEPRRRKYDNQTVIFNTLSNLAHQTAIAGVKIGSSKKGKEKEATVDTPEEVLNQVSNFLTLNAGVEGQSMNYETYLRDTLGFLQDTSPTLQDFDAQSSDAYTLIPLHDNYVSKKAYQNTQLRVEKAKTRANK